MDKQLTLVATLGGQPQVVTFALDTLLARGYMVAEVQVVYLEAQTERLQAAVARLRHELKGAHYRGIVNEVIFRPISRNTHHLKDIRNDADAEQAWQTINQLLAQLKRDGRTVHVCVSGGRRMLALQTMSAAMLYFGDEDRLWHMYTPDEVQAEAKGGAIMHLPANTGFQLIKVPMLPWGRYFPFLRELAQPAAAGDVLARQRGVLDSAERKKCQAVIDLLTRRQLDVLRQLAKGLHPDAVAEALGVKRKTVDTHKTVIFDHCRNVWGLPDKPQLDYRFIEEKFGMI